MIRLLSLLLAAVPAFAARGGCSAVTRDQCDEKNACLRCGTKSGYDCEQCCPGCSPITKGSWTFCECKKPGPAPAPPDWTHYAIDGMDVMSTTKADYEKVVIMLHGGGGSGSDWTYQFTNGWFGNMTGIKYVFPTSPLPGHVWYIDYKNGCGLTDDCAYNISSIRESAGRVAALIEHEKRLVGGDPTRVYLAGFSEGAQLTGYMQLAKLTFALGGVVVMDGFPLPPLIDMPESNPAAARQNATYYGGDMRWMIWHGENDPIFPVHLTLATWSGILEVLGARETLKIQHSEPGMTHTLIEKEFEQMVQFIRT